MSGQTPPTEETNNPNNPPLRIPYAFGILETDAGNYALRMGDATSGDLHTV